VSQRAKLVLTSELQQQLAELAHSRKASQREVQEDRTFSEITTRRLLYECVDRTFAMGVQSASHDLPHGREEHTILPQDKAWLVHRVCTKPKELGVCCEAALQRLSFSSWAVPRFR